MDRRILFAWLALIPISASISSCASQSISTEDATKSLKPVLNDYLQKQAQLSHHRIVDLKVSSLSSQSNGAEVSALFSVNEKFRLDYAKADDTPALKGKLRFIRDNGKQLSIDQQKRAKENIEMWRHDLNEYITTDQQGYDRYEVVGKLDSNGKPIASSIKLYHEGDGPNGKGIAYYLCDLKKDIPTPQEVEKESYNAIKAKVSTMGN